MILYGLPNCDACRKALKELKEAGREVEVRDVRKDGLTGAEAARFEAQFGDALVNRRSTTWRGLADAERAMPPAALILAHPTVMKRPVIDDGARLWLGWTDETRAALA